MNSVAPLLTSLHLTLFLLTLFAVEVESGDFEPARLLALFFYHLFYFFRVLTLLTLFALNIL